MPDNSNQIQESTNISSKKIREPRQKRSIEKKNKIIKAGMELILENGYHSTTTADIAKKAGVSTGIVYSYFEDKKHILLSGLTDYIIMTQNPTFDFLKDYHQPEDWDILLKELIDHFVEMHKVFFKSHQELNALATLDADVRRTSADFRLDGNHSLHCAPGTMATNLLRSIIPPARKDSGFFTSLLGKIML